MGYLLRRQYDLATIVIRFELSGRRSMVRCCLERDTHGEKATALDYLLDPGELGLPDRLDRNFAAHYHGNPFHMPSGILDALRTELDAQLLAGEAVWLYLKSPVGYLAFVPWEEMLVPWLNRPVLRLPDFLVDPARVTSEFNAILCSSQPISEDAFLANQVMASMAELLLGDRTRRVNVHLFTDAALVGSLTASLDGLNLPRDRVIVHDPQGAAPFAIPDRSSRITDPTGQLNSPWLLWMQQSMAGRSVDLVHFLAHGYLAGESGVLSVAESPLENYDVQLPRFVGPNEISAFLAQVGAWSCIFSSPMQNYSEMALRQLGVTIANLRPGMLLHHEMRLDGGADALARGYEMLLSEGTIIPPITPALSVYCHPGRVGAPPDPLTGAIAKTADASLWEADETNRFVEEVYTPEEEVPGWVSAAMRYIDQRTLEVAKQSGPTPGQAVSTSRMAGFEESDTLRRLQQIVEEEARAEAGRKRSGGEQ